MTIDVAGEVDEIVHRFLPANRGPGRVGEDDSFAELGMNSVALLEMVVQLEDRFGIDLTDDPGKLAGIDSLRAGREWVTGKVARR